MSLSDDLFIEQIESGAFCMRCRGLGQSSLVNTTAHETSKNELRMATRRFRAEPAESSRVSAEIAVAAADRGSGSLLSNGS